MYRESDVERWIDEQFARDAVAVTVPVIPGPPTSSV
jgi:hypothetical protein